MILVTGAAGKTGQAVIKALAVKNINVRAFVYRDTHVERVQAAGATDVVTGSMENPAAFQQAMQGVEAVYHICPNMNPNEVEIGQIAIEAARQAGVRHFVYHSVLHPQTEKMPHHWNKLRVEEMLFEQQIPVTILQPAAYMQNILAGWSQIVEQGIYTVPYSVDSRLAMVDLNDVADVVATVLTESGHAGAVYELVGPDLLSQVEIAAVLSYELGRSVEAQEILPDVWAEGAKAAGLGVYQIETLLKMFNYYQRFQFVGNSNVLGWLLNRPPTTFRQFVEREKAQ